MVGSPGPGIIFARLMSQYLFFKGAPHEIFLSIHQPVRFYANKSTGPLTKKCNRTLIEKNSTDPSLKKSEGVPLENRKLPGLSGKSGSGKFQGRLSYDPVVRGPPENFGEGAS
jgi:hypothetical protein